MTYSFWLALQCHQWFNSFYSSYISFPNIIGSTLSLVYAIQIVQNHNHTTLTKRTLLQLDFLSYYHTTLDHRSIFNVVRFQFSNINYQILIIIKYMEGIIDKWGVWGQRWGQWRNLCATFKWLTGSYEDKESKRGRKDILDNDIIFEP